MKRLTVDKSSVVMGIFIVVAVIYWVRLFQLQILDERYTIDARSNAIRNKVQYPGRGLILDRNGQIMVYNEAVYDLMVIPGQVVDADWALLADLLELDEEGVKERFKKACAYSRHAQSVFEKQISKETYGRLQEYLYRFPGFYVQSRTLRRYIRPVASHVLGDVGEVNESELRSDPYYQLGDYIGKSGLEKHYEKALRGRKGVKVVMVDVLNREKGSYKDGAFDTAAVAGEELYTTLDAGLQEYAEQLMQGKRGSIVAIEPATGEVLALVSAPTYDPNLLVGRIRSRNYGNLLSDVQKPLFNRALMAYYPPGSIFKLPQALIGLQEKVIVPGSGFACDKTLVGCHAHPDARSVAEGVMTSCNPYFYQVFRRIIMQGKDPNRFVDSRMGLEEWNRYIGSFGLGKRLEIDLPDVKSGFIPDAAYYDRYYGRNQWAFSTIYSLSIGQGEIGLIPLQMANLAAIMANRGYYITPHLVRAIGESKRKPDLDLEPHRLPIDRKYFEPVVEGMYGAVHFPGGTARRAWLDSIAVCGKTGTSENPHGEDHAVFIGFAPRENPRIAISVFLENSGFGGTWAAPMASLLIEKYLTGKVKRTQLERQVREFTIYTVDAQGRVTGPPAH